MVRCPSADMGHPWRSARCCSNRRRSRVAGALPLAQGTGSLAVEQKTLMTGKPETQLQTAIVKALRQMGVWVIVMNVTKRRGKRGVNCGEPGMPDLCLVTLGEKWSHLAGWIEVKMPGEKLSEDQVSWHDRASEQNVLVGTADSITEAIRLVRWWREPF